MAGVFMGWSLPKVAALALLSAVAFPAMAGDGFYNGHLLPRLERNLESVPAVRPLPVAGEDASGQAVYEYVLESARHQAERSARKALKSYLLEVTSLDYLYRSMRGERKARGPRKERAVDCGVRISHGAAKLELRGRLRGGELTAGVDSRGGIGVEYDRSQRTALRFMARYDARDRSYDFSLRFDF
jgi:hypothetical protein